MPEQRMNMMSIVFVKVPEKGNPVARSAIDMAATRPATTIDPSTIFFDKSDMRPSPFAQTYQLGQADSASPLHRIHSFKE